MVIRSVVFATFTACAALTTNVRADAVDDEAAAYFADAKQLATQGKWAEACVRLEKSSALRPRMSTTYRLAECYEHVGRLASAWRKYLEASDAAGTMGETAKQQEALGYAKKLDARVPKLTIVVKAPTPGMVVRRDNVVVADAELGVAVPLDPGPHRVEASAIGHQPFAKSVTLAEGETSTVDVPALTADGPEPRPPGDPAPTKKSSVGTIGLITGGVGAVTLTIGTVLAFSARARYAEGDARCPGGLCDREGLQASEDGRTRARTATWVLATGGVLLGAGLTLFLTAPSAKESVPSVALSISPMGAFAVGRF